MMAGMPAGATASVMTAPFLHEQLQLAYTDKCVKDAETCSLGLCQATRTITPLDAVVAAMEGDSTSSAEGVSVSATLALLPLALLVLTSAL
jgi:hypothetical protein